MAVKGMSSISLDDTNYVMVAAIDFGTTFSGYAFSFKTDQTSIMMNKSWGENVGFQSYKTPTSVLTNDSGEFVAFGYEAEDRYGEQTEEDSDEEDDKSGYQLYKHFKMMLHSEGKLTSGSKICSTDGTISPALPIFKMALKYLKDHLLEAIRKQVTSLDESLIKWVLTVPAIWREEAKQFMREAAYKAGLIPNKDSRKLCICLEPEAASILCRNMEINKFADNSDAKFKTGTKYIVVDAGGGTVDVTIHQVLITGNVKEVHRATGGAWGGTKVDDNFVQLLENIIGKNFLIAFKKEYPHQWFTFMVNFEKLKRAAKPDGKSKININIPWSMPAMFKSMHGKEIEKVIKGNAQLNVSFSQGVLIVKPEAVRLLFKPVTDKIVAHIEELISSPKVQGSKYLLLVGGFAQSEYLHKALEVFCEGKMTVLTPAEAQMAIIKGAVLFGHKPSTIETRIAKQTYGIHTENKCDKSKHDVKYLYTDREGQLRCRFFDKHINKDEEIKVGEKRSFTYCPMYVDQKEMIITFYCVDRIEVTYVKEDGVIQIGDIAIQMPNPDGGLNRKVKVDVTFGGTEMQVEATDIASGCAAHTVIDFLSE